MEHATEDVYYDLYAMYVYLYTIHNILTHHVLHKYVILFTSMYNLDILPPHISL